MLLLLWPQTSSLSSFCILSSFNISTTSLFLLCSVAFVYSFSLLTLLRLDCCLPQLVSTFVSPQISTTHIFSATHLLIALIRFFLAQNYSSVFLLHLLSCYCLLSPSGQCLQARPVSLTHSQHIGAGPQEWWLESLPLSTFLN